LRRRPLGRYRYVRLRWRVLFAVIDAVGSAVWGIARFLRRSITGYRAETDLGEFRPRRILLVQLDHLGDGLISTVLLPLLRRRWPEAEIEVLASPSNRAVFEAATAVDRVHVAAVNRFARRRILRWGWLVSLVGWGWHLRRRGVDLAIDARGEFPLALLCWLSGAHVRVGWSCGGGGFLLTHAPTYVHGRPEVASRLALLAELGIRPASESDARPRFRVSQTACKQLSGELDRLPAGPLVVVHVGAGMPAKQWPAEHWRTLVAELHRRHAACVVLVGDTAERPIAAAITAGQPKAIVDWTGRLTLDQLAALVERAELFLGADSGPAHLAAAVDTPVVALFSGTNQSEQWQPCGRRVVVVRQPVACAPCHRRCCPRPDHPCMTGLSPAAVLTAAERMLCGGDKRISNLERPTVTIAGKGVES
jgi:heptosyltransferase-2